MSEQPATPQRIYRIQREKVARYFFWMHILLIIAVGIWVFGIGLIAALVYAFSIGEWLPQKQANALRYWLDGPVLRVEEGVYSLKRKAIPLDRITDLTLWQPIFMRPFDIWFLTVQTGGTGTQVPEAVLVGLHNPEAVRDEILKAREVFLKK